MQLFQVTAVVGDSGSVFSAFCTPLANNKNYKN